MKKILYVYRFASLVDHKGFFSNDILKNYILFLKLIMMFLQNNKGVKANENKVWKTYGEATVSLHITMLMGE